MRIVSGRLGVWLTTVDSRAWRDRQAAAQALVELSGHGFTRVALPRYVAGFVTWPLRAEANPLGVELDPDLPGRDHVRELLRQELGLVRQRGFSGIDLFLFDSLRPHLPLEP